MKIRFLLIGTSLSLSPQPITAQCVATQDCATLGYTETSCSGGSGVKCPFGNKWACFKSDSEVCQQYGFTLTCTGTNQTGGVGKACNGKYSECTCASGYEWKSGKCQNLNGVQGDLYYCNGTVVAVKAPGMNFYVAMKDLGYMNWSSANSGCQNYSFCGNLKGTLPSKDQLVIMYNNKSLLEFLLTSNGGKKFSTGDWYWYWSSTYRDGSDDAHYGVGLSSDCVGYSSYYDYAYGYVRPILTSW